jgi:hypothetical protein
MAQVVKRDTGDGLDATEENTSLFENYTRFA